MVTVASVHQVARCLAAAEIAIAVAAWSAGAHQIAKSLAAAEIVIVTDANHVADAQCPSAAVALCIVVGALKHPSAISIVVCLNVFPVPAAPAKVAEAVVVVVLSVQK